MAAIGIDVSINKPNGNTIEKKDGIEFRIYKYPVKSSVEKYYYAYSAQNNEYTFEPHELDK